MEFIDKVFSPSSGRIAVPLLIFLMLLVALSALVQTMLPDSQWMNEAAGWAVVAHVVGSAILLAASVFTRLVLHSDGVTFEVSILFAGLVLLKRSVSGPSWHAVATPGGWQMEVEGSGRYRVEVATDSGARIRVLGPCLCWLFKIECL